MLCPRLLRNRSNPRPSFPQTSDGSGPPSELTLLRELKQVINLTRTVLGLGPFKPTNSVVCRFVVAISLPMAIGEASISFPLYLLNTMPI